MRAFFNILLDQQVLPIRWARRVADEAALRAAASVVVRALVQRYGGEAQLLDAALRVTDAEGAVLLDISFFEALYLPIQPVADPERRRTPKHGRRPCRCREPPCDSSAGSAVRSAPKCRRSRTSESSRRHPNKSVTAKPRGWSRSARSRRWHRDGSRSKQSRQTGAVAAMAARSSRAAMPSAVSRTSSQ